MSRRSRHEWFAFRHHSSHARRRSGGAAHRRRLRYELLEDRCLLSVTVEVLDPVVEPGQDVPVRWEVARSYVDADANGTIEADEVADLTVVLDVLGGIKNHVQFIPSLDADCYVNSDGNLVGIATVPIPFSASLGITYQLWATIDNGIDDPLAAKSLVPVTLTGSPAAAASSSSDSPFQSEAYRRGVFEAPTTELTANFLTANSSNGTITVANSNGFPTQGPFDIWITSFANANSYARYTVTAMSGSGNRTWNVTKREVSPGFNSLFFQGSSVVLDPVDTYALTTLGITRSKIEQYAESINGDAAITNETSKAFLEREAALIEMRAAEAYGSNPSLLQSDLKGVLSKTFGGNADFLGAWGGTIAWNSKLPTIVFVHGILDTKSGFDNTVADFALALQGKANVLRFYWGNAIKGLDRTIDALFSGVGDGDERKNLAAAANLNKLLRILNRAYQATPGAIAGGGAQNTFIVAHSQGTVVTTAALNLKPTILNAGFGFDVAETLFMGANLSRDATQSGGDLGRLAASAPMPNTTSAPDLLGITNLYSLDDHLVSFGFPAGAGHQGFVNQIVDPAGARNGVYNFPVEKLADDAVGHTDWWSWLLKREKNPDRALLAAGIKTASTADKTGFIRAFDTAVKNDAINYRYGQSSGSSSTSSATPIIQNPGRDLPFGGFGRATSGQSSSAAPPTFNNVNVSSPPGSGTGAADEVGIGIGAELPDLTIKQGQYFIAEAVGAVDPDGYIFRADFYRDVNGNGLPDDNDQEYLGTDFDPGNGWKRAIYTRDWAVGTYNIIAQVFDNGGNASNLKVATVAVIDPNSPPGPLPLTFDNSQRPQFNIFPHRNGDVSYDPGSFSLVPGSMDLWQITPQTGGGFNFETTGNTDTVLGLYDWATGALLASDRDNGAANNAEITYTLAAGHTYMLIVASERGDSGAYGLDVTGANQSITATPIFTAPRYETAVSESIATPFELDYFKTTVPATTTTLNVLLDVSTGLDGWVRVENAAHETLATAFLGAAGVDETLSAIDVTPGADVFITVAALGGTTGSYTLNLDFGPDDAGLPATLATLPATRRIVPLPDGTFTLANTSIVNAGKFNYYAISTRQSEGGSFTFETFGNLDTQVGVYTSSLVLLGTDDDSGAGENARLTLNLNAGEDYIVVVRGEGNDTGSFDLSMAGPAASVGPLIISGLASATTSNFNSFANNYRYYHYQAIAPANATKLTVQTEVASGSGTLDLSVRVSDSDGNVLATANTQGPGIVEQITNLAVTGGQTYFVTVYSENYTNGSGGVSVDFDPNFTVGSGNEFPVNSSFFGEQNNPGVAQNSSGQTVAVWSFSDLQRVDAQRFGANNQPVGGEIHVNAQPLTSNIGNPAVGISSNGNFVVLFGDDSGLFYRMFDFNGNPLTGQLSVGFSALNVDIAVKPDGGFIIVGTNNNQVLGRVFSASGSPLTGTLALHTTTGSLVHPSVSSDGQGRYVVAWHRSSGNINNIYAMRVDGIGNTVTGAFQVAPEFTGFPYNPTVASHGDGTFVVAFDGDAFDGTGNNIYARRFDENANPESDLLLLNTVTAGNQTEPKVALLSQGKFLVAWKGTDSNDAGIRAQQIGVNLERIGPEFTLNKEETGTQQKVALSSDGNEKISAVWQGPDVSVNGIFGLNFTMAEVKEPELTVTDSTGVANDRFVNFGSQVAQVGGTILAFPPATVTIKNDGNAPLVVSSVDFYGADSTSFALNDSSGFTLNPGQSRAIVVTFTGRKLGDNYANLRLDHNDNSDILTGDFDADPYWVSLLARIESPFVGDYDVDGDVDQVDYNVWRTSFGETIDLQADGNKSGIVDAADYVLWRKNSGATLASHTISGARQPPLGSTVTLAGVVTTTTDLINSTTYRNFFIQDAMGGIAVFGTTSQIQSLLSGITEGDSVAVTGVTDSSTGLFELDGLIGPLSLFKTGQPGVPQPLPVTAAMLANFSTQAESLEGMLVKLSGVSFVGTGMFAGAQNYTVTDGATQAVVRVSTTQQDIVGTSIPTGPVNLVGILNQFDATIPAPAPGVPGKGYQLLLRTSADIVSNGAGAGAALGNVASADGGSEIGQSANSVPISVTAAAETVAAGKFLQPSEPPSGGFILTIGEKHFVPQSDTFTPGSWRGRVKVEERIHRDAALVAWCSSRGGGQMEDATKRRDIGDGLDSPSNDGAVDDALDALDSELLALL